MPANRTTDIRSTTASRITAAVLPIVVLFLSACIPNASADKLADLEATSWTVVGIPKQVKASMSFGADGKVTGSLGCNRFTTHYNSSGQTIEIGQIATTRKMCPPVEMSVERELLETLPKVSRWSGTGRKIELTVSANNTRIRLERAVPK